MRRSARSSTLLALADSSSRSSHIGHSDPKRNIKRAQFVMSSDSNPRSWWDRFVRLMIELLFISFVISLTIHLLAPYLAQLIVVAVVTLIGTIAYRVQRSHW